MDVVLKETLRLYPLASLWDFLLDEKFGNLSVNVRQCMESTTAGSVAIEKGVCVWADVWSIHQNKDVWGADADKFRPERLFLQ